MSRKPKEMTVTIDGITFDCCKREDGSWYCVGKFQDVIISLDFPRSAPTHVFQHIEHIVKTRL